MLPPKKWSLHQLMNGLPKWTKKQKPKWAWIGTSQIQPYFEQFTPTFVETYNSLTVKQVQVAFVDDEYVPAAWMPPIPNCGCFVCTAARAAESTDPNVGGPVVEVVE